MPSRATSARTRDVLVLCYHAISDSWPDMIAIGTDRFEAQVRRLLQSGWNATTFAQAVLDPPAGRTFVVTFDDAFRSTCELGAPILQRLGVAGTLFVPTAFPDSGRPLAWPRIDRWVGTPHERELEPASWEQLEKLQCAGWEIGSHTISHPRLTALLPERQRAELGGSKAELERRLGVRCRSIAYPYSDVDAPLARLARECGYEAGAALLPLRHRHDPLRFPRVFISASERPALHRLHLRRSVRWLQSTAAWSRLPRPRPRPTGGGGAT